MATLEEQIRQRWGQFGDWQSAGQDQTAALAQLLRASGVDDLSQFHLKARDYTLPGKQEMLSFDNMVDTPDRKGTAFDAFYRGSPLGFLGDVNRDGSMTASPYGGQSPFEGDLSAMGLLKGNGDLLGWSSQGGGNTSFQVIPGPNGEPIVVPVWGSSSQSTYDDLRGIASIAALAAGGTFAGAGGTAGAAAQGGLQGAALAGGGNTLFGDGDVNSLTSSILGGAATGAIGGGLKAYGAEQGWNPAVTRAATSGATTVARGGSVEDAGLAALTSGANTLAASNGITGNAALDSGLLAGGQALLRGGSGSDALRTAGLAGITGSVGGLLSGSGQNNLAGSADNALSPGNVVQFEGNNTMASNDFNWDQWVQDQIAGSNRDTNPWQFDWADLGVDPGAVTGNEGRNYPTTSSTQGPGGSPVNASNAGTWAQLLKSVGGGGGLAAILGGLAGVADGQDKTQSANRDPWLPAQDFLKQQIGQGQQLSQQYQAQPFSQAQQTAYGNVGGLLDLINHNAPGLMAGFSANAQGQNNFARGQPNKTLIGSSAVPGGPGWQPGLLGSFGTRKG